MEGKKKGMQEGRSQEAVRSEAARLKEQADEKKRAAAGANGVSGSRGATEEPGESSPDIPAVKCCHHVMTNAWATWSEYAKF